MDDNSQQPQANVEPSSAPQLRNTVLSECLSRMKVRLEYILNNFPLDLDYLEFIITQERTFLSAFENMDVPNDIYQAIQELSGLLDQQKQSTESFNSVVKVLGPCGRYRLQVTEEHLRRLLELGLPATHIAALIGVSRRTLYRRMEEYNLSVRTLYSTMSDEALDAEVRAVKLRLPHAGYQIVKGCLQAEGHRLQWARIKASMHRVDSEGILSRLRSMGCVVRRKYSVRGPHFLQHIDTNHKLIRYNMVIFGGIDGFSRRIMYLNAACNNTASTALEFFLDGVQEYGWPYKVRADQGVENVKIAEAMFSVRGTGRGSFISGKSVHNQRVERLWRDVWTGVTHVYYDVLHSLEEDGLLDISDALHLFCAQYTFLPRLKVDLSRFSAGWNDHPIRTEAGLTPNQLWEIGMLHHPIRDPEINEETVAEIQMGDIDWESTGLSCDYSPGVTVPQQECPLTSENLAVLRLAVDPLATSQSYGRDIYLRTQAHTQYLLNHHI